MLQGGKMGTVGNKTTRGKHNRAGETWQKRKHNGGKCHSEALGLVIEASIGGRCGVCMF